MGAGRLPEAQRDLLELPALAEVRGNGFRGAAVGIGVEKAAILVREDLGRGGKALVREQPGEEAGERAARLVELDGRRTPLGESAGRLAAGKPERMALALGVEAKQLADRGRAAERADHARRMPAARAERGVLGAQSDAHGAL